MQCCDLARSGSDPVEWRPVTNVHTMTADTSSPEIVVQRLIPLSILALVACGGSDGTTGSPDANCSGLGCASLGCASLGCTNTNFRAQAGCELAGHEWGLLSTE